MNPALLALAAAAALSTAFAAVEAVAFAAVLAVPVLAVSSTEARAADTLYRWKEPDGALTFSPTPPTDDTAYEVVDPTTMRPVGESSATNAAAPIVRAEPIASAAEPTFTDPLPTAAAAGTVPPADRPGLGAATRRTSGSGGFDAPIVRVAPLDAARAAGRPDTDRSTSAPALVASSEKDRRCEELSKRVVSLERRLATPLTPDAMDATVVQMARYQQSVDRHCR